MSDTRIEKDSLGEVEVPADAYYGAQTERARQNFPVSGLRFPRRFIAAMGLIKSEAAKVNSAMGIVEPEITGAIGRAADEVVEGRHDAHFPLDIFQTGSGTSTNMNANEVISNRAIELLGGEMGSKSPVHPNDHVNAGQSSNDTIPTAIHLSCRLAVHHELIPSLEHLRSVLAEKAQAFDGIVKSGRTHLMDATPVRLGQEFGGYAKQVEKAVGRIRRASDEMSELALGGTATGTGINTHEEFAARTIARLSEVLGLEFREAEDHFEAQGGKDACVSLAGALNAAAAGLMKIADDTRWLASGPTSGLSEIQLPAVQPGSSIMPGKVNPVMAEALMMVCARVAGNATTVTIAGGRGNFELNVMMPVMADALLESITLLANATRAFADRCVAGIEARPERARELLEKNPSIATALNPYIGYDKAAEIAKQAAKEGRSVRDVAGASGLLDEATLDDALDVRDMTEPGLPS